MPLSSTALLLQEMRQGRGWFAWPGWQVDSGRLGRGRAGLGFEGGPGPGVLARGASGVDTSGSSVRAREDLEDECMLPSITLTLSQAVSSALVLVLPATSLHLACLEGRAYLLYLSALQRQIPL